MTRKKAAGANPDDDRNGVPDNLPPDEPVGKNEELPIFGVWVQKWFGSSRIAECHPFAQGIYALMLFRAWKAPDHGIPADENKLRRMLGLNPEEWTFVRQDVLQFFDECHGRLYNDTLGKEWNKAR